ncbi:YceD family protein [Novacetimonas cocois]|uniref:DUF177 domain-containing protein n=1 Tax=Novacetimonas cocois TaxID=1747507 RepID=A0A365Z3G5_9PROT|nr:DUF177 domain-containing protein [Novacetimonas cocois]RBM09798.1 hypothetical protein NJLHNGOC_01265 [Novacetimonas cocois]
MEPEFSRRVPVGRIALKGMETSIEATPDECAALARRFRIPAIRDLACRYRLVPGPQGEVMAEGWLTAHVTQECVISLEPFEDAIAESFTVRCIPAERFREDDEVDPFSIDEVPYERESIDIGELAAEELSLGLDPYPHKPGSVIPAELLDGEDDDGEEDEEPRRQPFAALADLKKKHN